MKIQLLYDTNNNNNNNFLVIIIVILRKSMWVFIFIASIPIRNACQ